MPRSADDMSSPTGSSKREGALTSSAERGIDSARAASRVPTGGASFREFDSPRGLLDLASGQKRFRLARYHPSAELGFFVEHYWTVEWDLTGQADHQQESLPHPSVHVTVERGRFGVVGVV